MSKVVVGFSSRGANKPQAKFFRSCNSNMFNAFVGGIGSGKSLSLGFQAFRYTVKNQGLPGLIVGCTHNQTQTILLPEYIRFLEKANLYKSTNQARREIYTHTGSIIKYATAEKPSSFESVNAAWAIGDEIRYWKKHSFSVFLGRVRVPGPNNGIAIASTPESNWMRTELERKARKTDKPKWNLIRCSTRENLHNLREDFYDDLVDTFSAQTLAQYVDGNWSTLEGCVYDNYSETENVCDIEYEPRYPVYVFVDFGYNFPSVLFVQFLDYCGQHRQSNCFHVLDEMHPDKIANNRLAYDVKRYGERQGWRISEGFCDPAGNQRGRDGLRWVDEWEDAGIELHWSDSPELRSIANSIDLTRRQFCDARGNRKLYIDSKLLGGHERGIIRSIENYKYPDDKAYTDIPKKDGYYDHVMDGLRYGVVNLVDDYGKLSVFH